MLFRAFSLDARRPQNNTVLDTKLLMFVFSLGINNFVSLNIGGGPGARYQNRSVQDCMWFSSVLAGMEGVDLAHVTLMYYHSNNILFDVFRKKYSDTSDN